MKGAINANRHSGIIACKASIVRKRKNILGNPKYK